MSGHPLVFIVSGYTGWDTLLSFLPKRWQVRWIAKAWLRSMARSGFPADPSASRLIVQMPWGSWRIIDAKGRVEPCSREHFPMA